MKPSSVSKAILTGVFIATASLLLFNFNDSSEVTSYISKQFADTYKLQRNTSMVATVNQLSGNSANSNSSGGITHMTEEDKKLMQMGNTEMWNLLTSNRYSSRPTASYAAEKSKISAIHNEKSVTIDVQVWDWKDRNDDTNMEKVTGTWTLNVNKELQDLITHVFQDIYDDPSKPVIDLSDNGRGCYVTRGVNNKDSNKPSIHAFGTAIDINPNTTVVYNGLKYTNMQVSDAHVATEDEWKKLPESHKKYQLIYKDCPIVKIFKAYSFAWGGDFTTSRKDAMHFSFIGEQTREESQKMAAQYNK